MDNLEIARLQAGFLLSAKWFLPVKAGGQYLPYGKFRGWRKNGNGYRNAVEGAWFAA
jgi:hypothetical protein